MNHELAAVPGHLGAGRMRVVSADDYRAASFAGESVLVGVVDDVDRVCSDIESYALHYGYAVDAYLECSV